MTTNPCPLTGICPRCNHDVLTHWNNPGCRIPDCRCTQDPVCTTCGVLTSKHEGAWAS